MSKKLKLDGIIAEANQSVETIIRELIGQDSVELIESVNDVLDLNDAELDHNGVYEAYDIVSVRVDSDGIVVYIDHNGDEHGAGISVNDRARVGRALIEVEVV